MAAGEGIDVPKLAEAKRISWANLLFAVGSLIGIWAIIGILSGAGPTDWHLTASADGSARRHNRRHREHRRLIVNMAQGLWLGRSDCPHPSGVTSPVPSSSGGNNGT